MIHLFSPKFQSSFIAEQSNRKRQYPKRFVAAVEADAVPVPGRREHVPIVVKARAGVTFRSWRVVLQVSSGTFAKTRLPEQRLM